MSLRGCARFLAAIGMRAFSILHPVTIVPAVGYAIVALICNQRICGIAGVSQFSQLPVSPFFRLIIFTLYALLV